MSDYYRRHCLCPTKELAAAGHTEDCNKFNGDIKHTFFYSIDKANYALGDAFLELCRSLRIDKVADWLTGVLSGARK